MPPGRHYSAHQRDAAVLPATLVPPFILIKYGLMDQPLHFMREEVQAPGVQGRAQGLGTTRDG